jgi:signal transduction histidine kinase
MSTQYLFQPFVWKHWSALEVLTGWLEVIRDRVVVALAIAAALLVVTRMAARGPALRAVLLAGAIVTGAAGGELALMGAGSLNSRMELPAILGHIVQWTALGLCVAGMYYLSLRENEARAVSRAMELQRQATEALCISAQLQSLRQQIEPHFLFNTLATIRRLHETGSEAGGRLLRHLLDYLRSTLSASVHEATLGEETDLASAYLAIVALRMPDRLRVCFDVPEELRQCECPPLSLATLIENAVKHGITPAPEGGEISVRARRDGNLLEIVVADTGVGLSSPDRTGAGGTGIGLANVRSRLRMLYDQAATLSVTADAPRGVRAVMRVPLRRCRS